jgi:hypothetical protein
MAFKSMSRIRFFNLIIISCFFLIFGKSYASDSVNISEMEFKGFLSTILRDYMSVTNLESVITIDTTFFEKQESGTVTRDQSKTMYEYTHSQDLFRIKSSDIGGNLNGFDIAWDGQQFQFYDKTDRKLTVSSNRTDGFGAVHPNILLLPFEFIKPPLDTTESHHLLWTDLNDSLRLQEVYINSTNVSKIPIEFHVKGGVYDGTPFFYKIRFSSNRRLMLPTLIEWVSSGGGVISKTIIEYAHSSPDCYSLPSRVERLGFYPDGTIAMQSVAAIDFINLNNITNLGVFKIDRTGVLTIFDSDSKVYLKNNKSRLFASRIMFFLVAAGSSLGFLFWLQKKGHTKGKNAAHID